MTSDTPAPAPAEIFFIDAKHQSLRKVTVANETDAVRLSEIHALIGHFTPVYRFENGDILLVNDTAIADGVEYGFDIMLSQPFAGNGVIIGAEDGHTSTIHSPASFIAEIEVRISWAQLTYHRV